MVAKRKDKLEKLDSLMIFSELVHKELGNLERQIQTIVAHKKSGALGVDMMPSGAENSLKELENMQQIAAELPRAMEKIEALFGEGIYKVSIVSENKIRD